MACCGGVEGMRGASRGGASGGGGLYLTHGTALKQLARREAGVAKTAARGWRPCFRAEEEDGLWVDLDAKRKEARGFL